MRTLGNVGCTLCVAERLISLVMAYVIPLNKQSTYRFVRTNAANVPYHSILLEFAAEMRYDPLQIFR